jgi:hypothetical protein
MEQAQRRALASPSVSRVADPGTDMLASRFCLPRRILCISTNFEAVIIRT